MDIDKDVRLLRKLSHFGLVNPMHDRERLAEIASHMLALYENNRRLGAALGLTLKFVTKRLEGTAIDEETLSEAVTLMAAIEHAMQPMEVSAEAGTTVEREFVLAADPGGYVDTTMPVVVETRFTVYNDQVVEAFHPAALPEPEEDK